MKLYYYESPNARTACAVARHLDAPVEFERIDLTAGEHRRPDYLALNPNGKVPTLVDGDRVLWESPAIACHLALKAGSPLWPSAPEQQIEVLRWNHWNAAHFNRHAGALFFEHIAKPIFGLGAPDPTVVEEANKHLRHFAKVLDAHLQSRRYLLGDSLSVADFSVAAMLPWQRAARLPLDGYAGLGEWYARLEALPAWRQPYPDAGAVDMAA
ncbi:glutathione S-transferase [Lysobacter sp. yr284]|uniref:glutathione S-transferase family protein n=1 Tax=Lysobacter sp. yr284 TaxID=1761791 RepID=UPI000897F1DE|nr:glutathione S-transferase family protein [Lysobacter sp. yr284]SDY22298.1 glutathione S-transferase [Lysobacter sp. yr284]